jgi:hypothetical protein
MFMHLTRGVYQTAYKNTPWDNNATCPIKKPDHRLEQHWSSNSDLELFTDSAGGAQLGFGIHFGGKWAQSAWPTAWCESDVLSDITFLELFPVVIAVNIWGCP